jgi:alpha-beta hydrolase superfamily lysophospholipase
MLRALSIVFLACLVFLVVLWATGLGGGPGLMFPKRLPVAEQSLLASSLGSADRVQGAPLRAEDLAFSAVSIVERWNGEKGPLRDGRCQARLRWAGAPGERTPLSIVYLHGFSASPLDLHPAFDRIADALHANLVQVLFTGHCSAGDALSSAKGTDWLNDAARGWALGAAIGKKVVLAGMSTGGSLALLSALHPTEELTGLPLHALVLMSPNFGIANPLAQVMRWPGGVWLAGLSKGSMRNTWKAETALRQVLWTTSYHLDAAAQVQVVVDAAIESDLEAVQLPVLMIHSREDKVIDLTSLKKQSQRFGSQAEVIELPGSTRHELAGDAINPDLTDELANTVVSFLQRMGQPEVRP